MGKHFWMKHVNDNGSHHKQPGCTWGLIHILDYHRWHSNVRKMIQHKKHEGQTNPKSNPQGEKSTERSNAGKKRSLRSRMKALIAEEISKGSKRRRSKNLERTYSIHHLESLDDHGLSKLPGKWKHPVIILPQKVEDLDKDATKHDSKQESDVLEIFKVDKELLIRHLQDADEGVANFTRSALGLNAKAKFNKSRSFPVGEVSKRRKFKPVKLENKQKEVWSLPKENKIQEEEEDVGKHAHNRNVSLSESLNKYAQLFENSSKKDIKLNSSRSLKLTNEHSHAPMYFRRIHSVSNADSYYSSLLFELPRDDGLITTAIESISILQNHEEEEENVALNENMTDEEQDDKLMKQDELSDNVYASFDHDGNPKKKCLDDLHYVRYLLDQSGITTAESEITWHASDQPFGPQLFEEVESCWPYEQEDQLTEEIWHHQMLFDLVNDVLVEIYDMSVPYYPKALSSSCRVRPYPVGNHIIEEVIMKIRLLLDVKPEEKQLLDSIMARDLDYDNSWMNLQLDSECVALEVEDRIFNELLEEVIFSLECLSLVWVQT